MNIKSIRENLENICECQCTSTKATSAIFLSQTTHLRYYEYRVLLSIINYHNKISLTFVKHQYFKKCFATPMKFITSTLMRKCITWPSIVVAMTSILYLVAIRSAALLKISVRSFRLVLLHVLNAS